MRWTGYIVLAFILYHLAAVHGRGGAAASFKANIPHYVMKGGLPILGFTAVPAGTEVLGRALDGDTGVHEPLSSPSSTSLAVGLLSLHLLHGGGEPVPDAGLAQSLLGARAAPWSRSSAPRTSSATWPSPAAS